MADTCHISINSSADEIEGIQVPDTTDDEQPRTMPAAAVEQPAQVPVDGRGTDPDLEANGAPECGDDDDDSEDAASYNTIERKWRESPFAVGLTKPTWQDDDIGCYQTCLSNKMHIHLTALICGKCRAGRVGNMVVLRVSNDGPVTGTADDGQASRRPRLRWVVGPYWPVPACLTVPALVAFALYAGLSRQVWTLATAWFALWLILNSCVLLALFQVSCSDPGILYRQDEPLEETWIWSDQALTFRPRYAKYDSECAVVIDHFDHTCPWTGTGIGKNNIRWFHLFVTSVFVATIFNAILLTHLW